MKTNVCRLACAVLACLPFAWATDVTTYHNDNSRSGQNSNESILTPQNVNRQQFGKVFSYKVDGLIYAQPLYLSNVNIPGKGKHNVVYVATEHDSVYAFDADSNKGANARPLWKVSFINPAQDIRTVSWHDTACQGGVYPEIGITGTPVIDQSNGTIYLVAETKEKGQFVQRLHALDAGTGAEKFGGPRTITAQVNGTGDGSVNGVIQFNPLTQNQRPALLLQNGQVYIGWASHCDNGPYHGWIMGYDAATLQQAGVWNTTPNAGLGGVWQSGGGLAGDAAGNLYFAIGNAIFDADQRGSDYGDSIIKLSPPSGGAFTVADYFTPFDQSSLNNGDTDLGSGGVLLLPDQPPGSPHRQLLVQSGKEGTLYLIDRHQMGHFHANNDSQIVQAIPGTNGGMWSSPAWWNNNIYLNGTSDYLRAFAFDVSSGKINPAPTSRSATFFRYPPSTPSVSAFGNQSGIVWIIQVDPGTGLAILWAYDALDLSHALYNSQLNPTRDSAGFAVEFTVPTIVNGKVYVGADHLLTVYGLLQ